jgi:hypothetical protein
VSTHVLNSWTPAAIRSSTSAILRWYVDRAKIEEKINGTISKAEKLRFISIHHLVYERTGQNVINKDLLTLAATLLAELEHRQNSTSSDTLKSPE